MMILEMCTILYVKFNINFYRKYLSSLDVGVLYYISIINSGFFEELRLNFRLKKLGKIWEFTSKLET